MIHRTTRALLVSATLNAILCAPIWSDVVFLHDEIINKHYQMRKSTLVTINIRGESYRLKHRREAGLAPS